MFKSKAQQRLMYSAAEGDTDKVPKKVAKEYISASKGMNFKRLKEKISQKKK